MVTFIVVVLFIIITIAFVIFLIAQRGYLCRKSFLPFFLISQMGKPRKRLFLAFSISFSISILAGVICISIAIPITTNKVNSEFEDFKKTYFIQWEAVNEANYKFNQSTLAYLNEQYGKEVKIKNAWLEKQKKLISTGIYWDIPETTRKEIMEYVLIPYVVYENGEYVLKW